MRTGFNRAASTSSLPISLLLLVLLLPAAAGAAQGADALIGRWSFKHGRGGQCASGIEKLWYRFGKDGSYEATTTLRYGAKQLTVKGRYTATAESATAVVDGRTIGPYPYRIVNDELIITHTEHRCEVVMEREDY